MHACTHYLYMPENASTTLMELPSGFTPGSAAAKSLQSCPTLCEPIDGSPPGSAVPGMLQARTLEWVAISFSNTWKWKVKVKSLSRVQLFATPWTAAHQAPLSLGFSRQEHWSGVPLPSPVPMITPLDLSLNRPTHSCQLKQLMYLSRWPQSSWLGPWAYKWTIRTYEHLRIFHRVMLRFINFINIILYWKRWC